MEKSLDTLEKYIAYTLLFLVPIAVLPVFSNALTTIKVILLIVGVAALLITKVAKMLTTGQLEISIANFDFPVLILLVAYVISALTRTPNRFDAFFLPGTATIVITSILFYFLANQLGRDAKDKMLNVAFFSGVIVAVVSLLSVTGALANVPGIPEFMKQTTFTTMGGNLPAAIFLGILIPVGLGTVLAEKNFTYKIFWGVALGVVTLGLLVNIYNMLPGKDTSPQFPSFATSWSIAVDSLKTSPVFGVGPGNYLTAFNRFRPVSYNQTDLWATRFSSARDFYLTVMTEGGLLATAGLILLFIVVYRTFQKETKEKQLVGWGFAANTSFVGLIVALVLLALFVSTPGILLLTFALMAINATTRKITLNLSAQGMESSSQAAWFATRLPAILVSLPIVLGLFWVLFVGVRAVSAEATYKKSLDALVANDGGATYDLMAQAINRNPSIDRYHASFTQVNLALANTIANQNQDDITDEDRQNIAQLIQQAIAEGKATVTLNPSRAGNWELLANTYRSVMAFADGADAFAIQTYNQAIALDPVNPNLRIALGGVNFALGNYEDAIDAFKVATLAKPDLANAHYNLAVAYRENGNIEKAIEQMNITLSLVDRDSQDYELVNNELKALQEKQPAEGQAQGEELTPPAEQEQAVNPPLELPEGAEPPAAPEEAPTPTPSPSPEGEESPAPSPSPTP